MVKIVNEVAIVTTWHIGVTLPPTMHCFSCSIGLSQWRHLQELVCSALECSFALNLIILAAAIYFLYQTLTRKSTCSWVHLCLHSIWNID